MREIKFRAWDGGRMFVLDVLAMSPEQWDSHGEGFNIKTQPHISVMQFTGLKDKNGKEIYEGDIYKNHLIFPITVEEFHGCRFMFGKDQLCKADAVYGEVIGNIHENPELLNPAR